MYCLCFALLSYLPDFPVILVIQPEHLFSMCNDLVYGIKGLQKFSISIVSSDLIVTQGRHPSWCYLYNMIHFYLRLSNAKNKRPLSTRIILASHWILYVLLSFDFIISCLVETRQHLMIMYASDQKIVGNGF